MRAAGVGMAPCAVGCSLGTGDKPTCYDSARFCSLSARRLDLRGKHFAWNDDSGSGLVLLAVAWQWSTRGTHAIVPAFFTSAHTEHHQVLIARAVKAVERARGQVYALELL